MSNSIKMDESRDFKGVWIPAELYLNSDLSPVEKLLIVEVDSLSSLGECFASNQHFADFLGLSRDWTRKTIASLVKRGYLESEIIYVKGTKQVEKRILRVVKTPMVEYDHTPMGENNHTPMGESDHISNTYIKNTSNEEYTIQSNPSTKVEHSREGFNNLSSITSNTTSSTLSESADALFEDNEGVNFSNIPMLEMAVLESCRKNNISRSQDAIDTISDFFVRFANTHKEKSNRLPETIAFDKLNKHIRTLISFKTKNGNRMSILDYKPEDIQWMIDDYFDYDFGERCTYSINHFMSKSVLSARFWRIENKLNRIAG